MAVEAQRYYLVKSLGHIVDSNVRILLYIVFNLSFSVPVLVIGDSVAIAELRALSDYAKIVQTVYYWPDEAQQDVDDEPRKPLALQVFGLLLLFCFQEAAITSSPF